MAAVRLQKILSMAGVASRRAAEQLIRQGRVSVNGRTVTEPGTRADPSADEIRVDGRRIKGPQRHRYFLVNKPKGYVSTRSDPQGRPTVIDLLPGVREHVYPVGRLDFESTGLLLLTNDGDLAARLTHPRHEIEREYRAWVLGEPDARDLERLRRGIVLDGRRTAPAAVEVRDRGRGRRAGQTLLTFIIREGRNRQVRRMCDAVGHPVVDLERVRIGLLSDARLKPGQARELTPAEVQRLRRAVSGP
ncbi:MAG TPA: pseudouridine synthase [Vicinamibacterales bacterium]|nr:pseudouridine synthase [Vicinamibacterales bacterium]